MTSMFSANRVSQVLFGAMLFLACGDTSNSDPHTGALPTFGAGDDVPVVSDFFRSGSRLRARAFVAEGGAALSQGFTDSQFDAPCAFALAADGKLRCLPGAGEQVFVDEGCSRIATGLMSTTAPRFLSDRGCAGTGAVVRRVGQRISATQTYVRTAAGACVAAPTFQHSFWALGEVVAPETFVAATVTRESRGGNLAIERRVAEDGAMEVSTALLDTERNATCGYEYWTKRCIPRDAAWASFYGGAPYFALDASCTAPIAQPSSRCGVPSVVKVEDKDACGTRALRLTAVGGAVHHMFQRNGVGGSCSAGADAGDAVVGYELGNPLAETAFPALGIVNLGDARIVVGALASASGEALVGATFIDTKLDAPCEARDVNGELRCAPGTSLKDNTYDDTACTTFVATRPSGCAIPSWWQFVTEGDSPNQRYFRVGALRRVGVPYRKTKTGCMPGTGPALSLYETTPYPTTDFVPMRASNAATPSSSGDGSVGVLK